jgi:DNA-binding GntR family transcriptional regulator
MTPDIMTLQSASDRAYEAIKEMISQYELIPGQKITYIQLAERLKMSKTPIINALHRLEKEEFVFSIPNRGFFIKEISLEEFEELYKVREALEMLAVEEAIKNQKPERLKEVEEAMIAHRSYDYDVVTRKRYALDAIFHLKIAEMSKNKSLLRMVKEVLEQIYFRHRIEGIPAKRLKESPKEHQQIIVALQSRNTPKAKRLIRQHLRKAKIAAMKGLLSSREVYKF